MKIQNLFNVGIIDKDSQGRFVAEGKLIDAENFFVNTIEGSGGGVAKNALGNALKTAYNITGGKTIGHGVNSSTNKVYNFIKGTNHDYIIEYDCETFVSAIVAQSTTGTRLNFISGERITNVDVIVSGEDGETLLAFSGDSNPPRILNIDRFKAKHVALGINWFTADEISLVKAPPRFAPVLTSALSAEPSTFLEDRFTTFGYRYKYNDNFHSVVSSWSEYFFVPGVFNIDFETFENLGMKNQNNAVDIAFNTGNRDVIGIDLVYRLSNSDKIYIIDKYIKSEEGWADNATQTIRFDNSKTYSFLPTQEYYHSFDNVPLSAKAQTIIGNRLGYADYVENLDMHDVNGDKTVMYYSLSLVSNDIVNKTLTVTKASKTFTVNGSFAVTDGQININFTGVEFIKDSSILVKFNILSDAVIPTSFKYDFTYYLPDDYTDLADFYANSSFKSYIETGLTDYFEINGGIVIPAGSTTYTIAETFKVSISGITLGITFPVIHYDTASVWTYYHDVSSTSSVQNIGVASSLKSNRSYEICQIYMDAQGRKTTALTSGTNTLFVPNSDAVNQNQIKVTIDSSQKPPKYADRYKFGIKFNTQSYETIPINIFFVDGLFRWIKLDGENKNKVKDGDILIVKNDATGFLPNIVKVKVLELKSQPDNFLSTTVTTSIKEPSGLYAKIKQANYDMQYGENEFVIETQNRAVGSGKPTSYLGKFTIKDEAGVEINRPIKQGSTFSLNLSSFYGGDTSTKYKFEKTYIAQADYGNFKDFYDAQILPAGFVSTSHPTLKTFNVTLIRGKAVYGNPLLPELVTSVTPGVLADDFYFIKTIGTEEAKNTVVNPHRSFLNSNYQLRYIEAIYVFETTPLDIDDGIYYETPETYTITAGAHQYSDHILTKTFNCYAQGNGIESNTIRDAYNEKSIAIDFCPTAVSADEYKQTRRFADITYSGVYNSNTNVNGLNSFNLYLANFKEDIDKSYGNVVKIKGTDSNLEVYQEDKCSKVYYGKDVLYNADGSSNLTKIEAVLGQQEMYGGEYGISYHAESFDEYAFNSYLTDTKRGIVLKKSNNGLFEISSQGMNSYFKKLFRDNVINQIIGEYDQYHDVYVLNIKMNDDVDDYVTWVYSDKDNGWLGRIRFNPEDMCRVNGKFLAFKNGEIWEHNQATGRNTFFGVETPSTFTINFPQEPSMRKNYKTMEIEGTDAWDLTINTDIDTGYVNAVDFNKEEGVYKAHTRLSNTVIDTSLLSVQGIGNCTVAGLVLSFGFNLSSDISIGDNIRDLDNLLVGTITAKTATTLTLNAVANIVSGDFVMCSKPQSANVNSLLGYHLQVSGTLTKNTKTELFAINTEVVKSYN